MSDRFTTLVRSYTGQLLLLTRRLYKCSLGNLIAGIPLFVVNQVSFVLALMLPLKVIIMLGSDGVPSYFRFFMTEETREAWMIGLVCAAVGMFLLYLATSALLSWMADRGGERVLLQSRKTGLFDDQERFASDIFMRVISTWGTVAMAVGGIALGLLLEWRLLMLVLVAIGLEFVLFALYWNRFREPERSDERERLVASGTNMLQNLSAFNVLLLFGGLVYLFLTDPSMNFIVGVLLFLLARQVLARSVRIFVDAGFFMQNLERIDALVHPGRHLREKRSSDRDSFERLLMPDRRSGLFKAVDQAAASDLAQRDWEWRDVPGKGVAMFVSPAGGEDKSEYRLLVKMRQGDAGLARETMFHRSGSARDLALSCEFIDAGSIFGRGYLLLRSSVLKPCSPGQLREMVFRVRTRLWQHRPEKDLTMRLLRSFPSLDARLTPERIFRLRVACNEACEEEALNELLERLSMIQEVLRQLPRTLCNRALTAWNILLTESGDPIVLNWEAMRCDVIGADLVPTDLERDYSRENLEEVVSRNDWPDGLLPECALPLVVHAAQIDRLIDQESYGAAVASIPPLLQNSAAIAAPAAH